MTSPMTLSSRCVPTENATACELVAFAAPAYIAVMNAHVSVYHRVAGGLALPLLLALGCLAPSLQAQEGVQMYRYINADGNKVIGYQVPPEYVANGYEILSAKGALIEVVPRTLRDDELQDQDARDRLAREAEEEQERLRRWDESLLLRYSTVEDIEAARERALRELKIRVSILKGKQRSLKQQVENYQAQAADQERLGYDVNQDHLKAIDDLQAEIVTTERAIVDRQDEIAAENASYDADVERFTTLLDIVELRKTLSTGDSG